ncbi:hypothetical protein SAMN02910264_01998 [Ruminococcaceae bacterium YAD3003]|jgi:hypothetical protein|nr:hypothetical protein SAMN02910264_01998 [Ruminococcaceae bacterium YAD3003]
MDNDNNKNESGFEEIDFRKTIEFFADPENDYSKRELYEAFVSVTRLYLDELISARNFENLFISRYGEEDANGFFEDVALCSETVQEGDLEVAFEDDPKAIIKAQFDLLDKLDDDDPLEE